MFKLYKGTYFKQKETQANEQKPLRMVTLVQEKSCISSVHVPHTDHMYAGN